MEKIKCTYKTNKLQRAGCLKKNLLLKFAKVVRVAMHETKLSSGHADM